MKKIIMGSVVALVVGLIAYTLIGQAPKAPELSYTNLEGQSITSQQLRGKVVLVNFWATNCSSCIQEMPELKATQEKYSAKGYQTIAVAMSYDPVEYVKRYTAEQKLPFFVTSDTQGSIAKAFGEIQLTPTSILIDTEGRIIKRIVGIPNFAELHQLIEQSLKT